MISKLFFAFTIMFVTCIEISCNDIRRNASHPEIHNESILKGKQLASIYCQSCHLLPDPDLLDTKSWEKGVLPHMGPRLGIFEFYYQRYPFVNDRNLGKDFYPSRPLVNAAEWQNIMDYYIAASPDSLTRQSKPVPLRYGISLFTVQVPRLAYNNPAISFLKIQPAGSYPQHLFISDLFKQRAYRFDSQLNVVDSLSSTGAIVDVDFREKEMLTCNMGIFDPTNEKYGDVRYILFDTSGKMKKDTTPLFDKLARPVQLVSADFNNDGKTDYAVCEFGYLTGALSWEENLGNGKYQHHIIKPVSGATRACVQDYNHDGLMDIWVLFAQGDEGIFLFINTGNGRFTQKEILRFPPMYGSSYFELADFNKDGYPDIVYTAGDNADYSTVLKPYHGVYIFINDGSGHFKEQYFYPVNGCYKAIARDFDDDGDLDLATIAFFADYEHQPDEGFIYFENTGNLIFKPFALPEGKTGRWITMDAGDIDGDGSTDLVLGNFSSGPTMMKSGINWKKGPPFIVLKNKGKKH